MNEDLITNDDDDMETFIFGYELEQQEQQDENNNIIKQEEISCSSISRKVLEKRKRKKKDKYNGMPSSTYDLYLTIKKKEKEKKKKKHKGKKKHKKELDNYNLPYVPMRNIIPSFDPQAFYEDFITHSGDRIPNSLIFDKCQSAFFFGRTLNGNYVGKKENDDGHIMVVGGSGSGKSISIAVPTMETWKSPIFSFDFKGDLIKWCNKRKSKILYMVNGYENNYWYDPFYLLYKDGEDNLVQNARELAQAIIPLPHNISDPFWIQSARDVLTGAIIYYCRLGVGFISSMIEIKTTRMSELLERIRTDIYAAVCINPDLDLNPKTLAGVSMELHNHISVFATDKLIQNVLSPMSNASKNIIKWEDLQFFNIFIRLDQSRLEQWSSVVRLMLTQLIRTLQRRPEKYEPEGEKLKPILLMLDEFPQYGKIDLIPSALKILRSKNVTFSIFCQSFADIDEIYGNVTRRTILDNCPYKVILNAFDAETQQYCSALVGTVKSPSESLNMNFGEFGQPLNYSFAINESRKPIIYPHEFASLSDVIVLHPKPEQFCRVKKETWFKENSKNFLTQKE